MIAGSERDVTGRSRTTREQAALRRIATLAAQGVQPDELFAVVAEEVGRVVDAPLVAVVRYESDDTATVCGTFPAHGRPWRSGARISLEGTNVLGLVRARAESARLDDYAELEGEIAAAARSEGMRSAVGVPIMVAGAVWGVIGVASTTRLPGNTGSRLAEITDLLAAAIANTEAREALAQLADEQAALRRVATLVARGARPIDVFGAVSGEVGHIFGTQLAAVGRFDREGQAIEFIGAEQTHERWSLTSFLASAEVLRTGRSARADAASWASAEGETAERLRSLGIVSTVASPIVVDGELWGTMLVASTDEVLRPDCEQRLDGFTELVATAIANAESRDARTRLAEEQAALRRVATLVAEGETQATIFSAVCEEVGHLLLADMTGMLTFPGDGTAIPIAAWSPGGPPGRVGTRVPLAPEGIAARILSTGAPARRDNYAEVGRHIGELADTLGQESTVGAPIRVGGRVWGALMAGTRRPGPWAAEAESRLAQFTELVGISIGNAESRDALTRLAEEQAALRRVATLVARDAPPGDVFDAVAMEVGKLLQTDITVVGRYDVDGAATATGSWSAAPGGVPVGTRSVVGGRNVLTLVAETEMPARVDSYDDASGEAAAIARRHGWRASIAAQIIVGGRVWGVMLVATQRPEPFPAGAEDRLAAFTDLVATAIANAETRSELAASRRRIVATADEARRRIERDLHDGIQQRLIALTFRARALTRKPPEELPGPVAELSEELKDVSDELREVSRGIHPTILTKAGLGPALRALARRSTVPIDVGVELDERLPAPVEAAAYYIASEAVTNVAKHARASVVALAAAYDDGVLTLEVRDDGVGGVDVGRGSGILGLTDRVEALGGSISIASPPGGGTTLSVRLPTTT